VDAHSDIIIPQLSDYKFYHGMPVSHLLGLIEPEYTPNFDWLPKKTINPEDICYIGLRNIDKDEK